MWDKIEKLLAKQHLSIYELAKRTGVHENTIRNIKTGKSQNPSFQTINRIANVLNVSLDYFRED